MGQAALGKSSHHSFAILYRSQVFIWNSGQFRLDHTFNTQQATDIAFLSLGPYLLVASETAGLSVLTRTESGDFATSVSLPLQGPIRVERLGPESAFVAVVTNREGPAQMLLLNSSTVTPTIITVSSQSCGSHVTISCLYPFRLCPSLWLNTFTHFSPLVGSPPWLLQPIPPSCMRLF